MVSPSTGAVFRRLLCERDGYRMASVAHDMVARSLPRPWRVYRFRTLTSRLVNG